MTPKSDTCAVEREAFEAAMAGEGYELNPSRYRDGTYRSQEYAAGWAMWQARASQPSGAVGGVSDAVNLAKSMLTVRDCKGITPHGVRVLCEAVMTMSASLASPSSGGWSPTAENVNALPQPIRDYIHGLAANCDPSGMVRENTQLRDTNAGLQKMYRTASDALAEVRGCFEAAEDEGLALALAETTDERLKDLVERRLMYAMHAAAPKNSAQGD